MQQIAYADAGMDMKKLGLCFIRKIRMVFAAAIIGALLGGIIYTIARTVPESEREYQAISKVYLDFAADETGEVYQAYNGYTWNDLMATDPLLDVTMGCLPADYTREEVVAATKAEILSDLRLLTLTITAHDADRCNAMQEASEKSLVQRGETAKEFRSITVIQSTPSKLVTADDRTVQAVLIGLAAMTILTVFVMMFYYVLDDRILIARDLKVVTDAAFIGYAGAAGTFGEDYEENLSYLREKYGEISILPVAGPRKREGTVQELVTTCDKKGAVVVAVEYGKVYATYLAYVLEQLELKECRVAGIAISGADGKFLSRYYGHAFGRQQKDAAV